MKGAPSGSAAQAAPATTINGYGEFNYNNYKSDTRPTQADLRRFVVGFHHRFDERLTFHSEVEFEHAVVSKDDEGEAEIEQAWVNYKFSDAVNVKGGLFLIPLGILNETHEPPTYYGVERNEVETRIIPTTWRELGVGVHGYSAAAACATTSASRPGSTPASWTTRPLACAARTRKGSSPMRMTSASTAH